MRGSQVRVQRDGSIGSFFGAQQRVTRISVSKLRQQIIALGQPRIGIGIGRVFHDRLGKCVDRLGEGIRGAQVPEVAALQVQVLCAGSRNMPGSDRGIAALSMFPSGRISITQDTKTDCHDEQNGQAPNSPEQLRMRGRVRLQRPDPGDPRRTLGV